MCPLLDAAFKTHPGVPTNQSMVRRLLTRLRTDQRGFTLVEQLVVAGLLVIIVSAIAGAMEVAEKITPQDTARAHQVRDTQVGLDRMLRELRHVSGNLAVTADTVEADVTMRGRSYRVSYDCSVAEPGAAGLRRCVRTEADGANGTQVVLQRVVNGPARPVFSTPSTRYVATTLEVELPAAGGRQVGDAKRVVLEGGIYTRNVDVAP